MGSLRALIDQASGYAETMFDADGVMPHIVAESPDGSISLYALAMGGAALDAMRVLVEGQLQRDGTTRWVFFSMAWMAEYQAGERVRGEPKDHPERIEVILFHARDPSGKSRLAHRQVLKIDGVDRIMPLVLNTVEAKYAPSIVEGR